MWAQFLCLRFFIKIPLHFIIFDLSHYFDLTLILWKVPMFFLRHTIAFSFPISFPLFYRMISIEFPAKLNSFADVLFGYKMNEINSKGKNL